MDRDTFDQTIRAFKHRTPFRPFTVAMQNGARDVLEYLAGGMSVDELLADFPELTAEDVRACWRSPPAN